jgi:O-antigen biosynthesis protein
MKKFGKILFIDRDILTFDQDAGSYIAFEYLKILNELCEELLFWPYLQNTTEPYLSLMKRMGINVCYDISFRRFYDQRCKDIDIIFTSRPDITYPYINILKQNPKARIFYIGHDLHYLREKREERLKGVEVFDSKFKYMKNQEEFIIKNVTCSLYFSQTEINLVKNNLQNANLEVIPWIQPINEKVTYKEFCNRKIITFLGGFSHSPNKDAVLWFINDILPLIKKHEPQINLYIVGSNPPDEILRLGNEQIKVIGHVSEDQLATIFNDSRIFISPLKFGAGFKGKIAKAMSFGLPVLTTSIGAEGIGLEDGQTALIANNEQTFCEKFLILYNNENLWKRISKNSLEHIEKHYTIQNAKSKIIKILEQS